MRWRLMRLSGAVVIAALATTLGSPAGRPGDREPEQAMQAPAGPAPSQSSLDAVRSAELEYVLARLRSQPRKPRLLLRAAQLELKLRRPQRAVEYLNLVLADDPRHLEALHGLAAAYANAGWPDAQLETLRKLVQLQPLLKPDTLELADIYLHLRWTSEALRVLSELKKLYPEDAEVWLTEAEAYFADARYAAARDAAQKVAALAPSNAAAWSLLADAQRKLKEVPKAGAAIQRAIKLSPQQPTYWRQQGLIRLAAGNLPAYRAAAEDFSHALRLNPADLPTRYRLGLCLARLGRADEARRELEKVAAVSLKVDDVALDLARLYRQQGREEPAKELLAYHEQLQKELTEEAQAEASLRQSPRSAEAHLRMGQNYLKQEDYGLAIVEFKQAMKLSPGQRPAVEGLTAALLKVSRSSEAAQLQERFGSKARVRT